jgi:hypothetical protein
MHIRAVQGNTAGFVHRGGKQHSSYFTTHNTVRVSLACQCFAAEFRSLHMGYKPVKGRLHAVTVLGSPLLLMTVR